MGYFFNGDIYFQDYISIQLQIGSFNTPVGPVYEYQYHELEEHLVLWAARGL